MESNHESHREHTYTDQTYPTRPWNIINNTVVLIYFITHDLVREIKGVLPKWFEKQGYEYARRKSVNFPLRYPTLWILICPTPIACLGIRECLPDNANLTGSKVNNFFSSNYEDSCVTVVVIYEEGNLNGSIALIFENHGRYLKWRYLLYK